jgi:hypothetical protein
VYYKRFLFNKTYLLQKNNTAAANRRLAQWRVKWLIEHSISHQLLWCNESFVFRNPPLHQAPKRWWQLKQTETYESKDIYFIFLDNSRT